AMATAADLLLCDRADAVLCGGCDELGPFTQHGVTRLAGAPPDDGGEFPAMHPYDRRRCGFLLGEGAVMLLLERPEGARARGPRPRARPSGLGRAGADPPRAGGRRRGRPPATPGAEEAPRQCLAAPGRAPAELDFIAGSGNGTALDELETLALR